MSNSGSSSVHNDWVKSIKSEDGNEVTRLDKRLVNGHLLDISLNKFPSNGFIDELNVGLFHVGGYVGGNIFSVWISSKTTQEA